MNFFGHALVAQRHEATRGALRAEFALGAMLPDFASMLRVRPPASTLAEVEAGLRFHHLTDDAFHGCDSFLEFSGQALVFLSGRGLSRGAARAVAHVGVELLLDAAFVSEHANEAYLRAVNSGLTERVASQIHWQSADSNERFAQLCHTLSRRGPVHSDPSPELIAERLRNILASRPRLALDDAGQSVVRDWARSVRPAIMTGAPLLLREVEQRLETAIGLER
jgi:acyl carrier protein phosphodiesterase